MADLTTQTVATAGTTITFGAAAGGGDHCSCGAGFVLVVKNGDGTDTNVTIATPGTVDGLAVADRVVVAPDGEETWIPLPTSLYSDPADSQAHITYSKVTSLTVACVHLP